MSLATLLLGAFGAGLLSFLAPCVVPLMPSYLSYLAGTSLDDAQSQPAVRWRVSRHALWFVLGNGMLLVLLGAVAALVGSAVQTYQQVFERIAGVLLILFGVALIGVLPIPWLSRDYHVNVKPGPSSWWRSGLLGVAFGASWSACVSPILASILVLTAVRSQVVLQGVSIMLVFALGQSVPLLLVGVLVDRAGAFLRRIRRVTVILTQIGGAILIIMGFFLVTGLFSGSG
ncbi:MAG TPA: cytochrome c biogenesis protein CcdA [Ktedonobacterales bacterium]